MLSAFNSDHRTIHTTPACLSWPQEVVVHGKEQALGRKLRKDQTSKLFRTRCLQVLSALSSKVH